MPSLGEYLLGGKYPSLTQASLAYFLGRKPKEEEDFWGEGGKWGWTLPKLPGIDIDIKGPEAPEIDIEAPKIELPSADITPPSLPVDVAPPSLPDITLPPAPEIGIDWSLDPSKLPSMPAMEGFEWKFRPEFGIGWEQVKLPSMPKVTPPTMPQIDLKDFLKVSLPFELEEFGKMTLPEFKAKFPEIKLPVDIGLPGLNLSEYLKLPQVLPGFTGMDLSGILGQDWSGTAGELAPGLGMGAGGQVTFQPTPLQIIGGMEKAPIEIISKVGGIAKPIVEPLAKAAEWITQPVPSLLSAVTGLPAGVIKMIGNAIETFNKMSPESLKEQSSQTWGRDVYNRWVDMFSKGQIEVVKEELLGGKYDAALENLKKVNPTAYASLTQIKSYKTPEKLKQIAEVEAKAKEMEPLYRAPTATKELNEMLKRGVAKGGMMGVNVTPETQEAITKFRQGGSGYTLAYDLKNLGWTPKQVESIRTLVEKGAKF